MIEMGIKLIGQLTLGCLAGFLLDQFFGWGLGKSVKAALKGLTQRRLWVGTSVCAELRAEADIKMELAPIKRNLDEKPVTFTTVKAPHLSQKTGVYHYVIAPGNPKIIKAVDALGQLEFQGKVRINELPYRIYRTQHLMHGGDEFLWEIIYLTNEDNRL